MVLVLSHPSKAVETRSVSCTALHPCPWRYRPFPNRPLRPPVATAPLASSSEMLFCERKQSISVFCPACVIKKVGVRQLRLNRRFRDNTNIFEFVRNVSPRLGSTVLLANCPYPHRMSWWLRVLEWCEIHQSLCLLTHCCTTIIPALCWEAIH